MNNQVAGESACGWKMGNNELPGVALPACIVLPDKSFREMIWELNFEGLCTGVEESILKSVLKTNYRSYICEIEMF